MRRFSIRTKFTVITVLAVLISSLAVGGISIASIWDTGRQTSGEAMNLLCDNRRQSVNEYLFSIEQSVDMVARYAGENLSSMELMAGGVVGFSGLEETVPVRDDQQRDLMDRYLRNHSEAVDTVFRSVANHTNGVLTYYYRFNPELSNKIRGFWYYKESNSQFVGVEPTQIPDYAPEDIGHVGWFYLPLLRAAPSWLEPYYNENLGVLMVSYVVPLFKAGTFIGVIGMDISYETLVSQIQHIQVYDSGYLVLTDAEGRIVYHPAEEMGKRIADVDPSFSEFETLIREDASSRPIRYRYAGSDRMMVFSTLSNGMKLMVVAPVREINASWTKLVNVVLVATSLILAGFVVLTLLLLRKITEPLHRLTEASRQLAQGNYNISLDDSGEDEVGVLTAAFQQLVNHLRVYISDLNSKAYQDAMTGVKNKGAFVASAKKLNDSIQAAEEGCAPSFAIVMLDCNNLKKINDTYGHEKGDIYLKNACGVICRVFTHSPVFRIGGDEFVVLLQKNDYKQRKLLLLTFDLTVEEINGNAANPWDRVSIAKGMAEFNAEADKTVEAVMLRADEQMYRHKTRMKAEGKA